MKLRHALLTALPLALLVCSAAAARAQGHSIRGKVRNAAGANVGRVTVTLEQNGAMVDQTVANNEGDFHFGGLGGTSYTVVVSAADYNPASESIEFVRQSAPDQPGESRTVEIMLTAKGGVRPPRAGLNFVQDVPPGARRAFEAGLKHQQENRPLEALAAYESALKIFPDYFDARFVVANHLIGQNRLDEAVPHLEVARRVNDRDDRVWHSFGIVLMRQGKFATAARVFGEAARLSPADAQYPLAQGAALVDHAAAIDPKKSQAAADERASALAAAEKSLDAALAVSKGKLADVHRQRARLYERRGDRARAADELELFLKKSPNLKNAPAVREAIKTLRAPAPAGTKNP
jgi:tetratricopeptide (TPR) repeat protein